MTMIQLRNTLILLVCAVLARPLHAGFGVDWRSDPENLKIVGAAGTEPEFPIVRLSVRGGLFFPGEKVRIGLARLAQSRAGVDGGTIEAVAFNTAQFDPTETGFVESRNLVCRWRDKTGEWNERSRWRNLEHQRWQ